jgi:uncharacterized protein YkwD
MKMRKGFVLSVLAGALMVWQWVGYRAEATPHVPRIVKHQPMEDIRYELSNAFERLNLIREAMGMPIMQESEPLRKAAQAHADYLVAHHLSTHFEESSRSGFSGAKPVDRALRGGYSARFVGENLSTKSKNARESVDGLFSAIYHRFGFLNLAFDEVGIGITQDPNDAHNSAFVYLMGNSEVSRLCGTKNFRGAGRYVQGACADTHHRIEAKAYQRARSEIKSRNPKIVLYPYDGQTDVPPAFYDEDPDPLPNYDVSGFPVTVEFNDRYFRKVELVSFRLYEQGGREVKSVRLLDKHNDPQHELTRRQFALMPLERLKYATTYRAEVTYRHKRKTNTIAWSFTTRKPTETLKVLRQKDTTISLRPGRDYWLYFVPQDGHDVLGTMRFPGDLYFEFVDQNTIRIVLGPERTRGFEIVGSGRRVRIEIH